MKKWFRDPNFRLDVVFAGGLLGNEVKRFGLLDAYRKLIRMKAMGKHALDIVRSDLFSGCQDFQRATGW